MSTLTQLEYLLAVDQERHFGKAAKACHVSQPSLSAQIQKLEDELELIIFDRSKKPILVTETGRAVIEQARLVIREHKKLQAIADTKSLEPKGTFELAVIPTLAAYVIPKFIGDFCERYPGVDLVVHEHKTDDIIRLLHNDELDAGLLVTPLNDDKLIERHLYYEAFYCYLNPDHPLNEKREIQESDLDCGDLWLMSEGHCFRNQMLKICSLGSNQCVYPNIRFESGSLETLIKLVNANSGFTLLPQMAVDELSPAEAETHIKAFASPMPTREVSLVYSRSFLKEIIISALEGCIIENLPPHIKSLKKRHVQVVDI
ncbi:MAG: LysR substrate-binding domain-containing protein [Desulfobacterales bacterium]|nr:LysR substrate-binding domain-containing protein [Desulfobacterales bacterium]